MKHADPNIFFSLINYIYFVIQLNILFPAQIPVGAVGPLGGAAQFAETEDQLKLRFQVPYHSILQNFYSLPSQKMDKI